MGQYFDWVDLDKREYIDGFPWRGGPKLRESSWLGNEETNAALTLLAGRWAGDRVVFLGDYAKFKDETDPFRRAVELELDGRVLDDYYMPGDESDVTGLFASVKESPCNFRWTEDCRKVPYAGPFTLQIEEFRYVVNETAHQYVDRERAPVTDVLRGEICRWDPIPELLCSERDKGACNVADLPGSNEEYDIVGAWFGHIVRPTNEEPPSGYARVASRYIYWWDRRMGPIINASDDAIREAARRCGIDLDTVDYWDEARPRLRRELEDMGLEPRGEEW
jgi:hypothetical protein